MVSSKVKDVTYKVSKAADYSTLWTDKSWESRLSDESDKDKEAVRTFN